MSKDCIGCGMLNNENNALAKENARLREALEIIANGAHAHRACDPCDFQCPVHEAKTALEGSG